VALAKARPGRLSYASTGIGGLMHLTGEFFRVRTGIDILHVPYRGAAPAVTDAAAGQVEMIFNGLPPVLPLAAEGRLRILAIATPRRAAAVPEVPTMQEAGLPGFDMSNAVGLVAPRGTPEAVIARLNAAARLAVADAGVRDTFLRNGAETIGSSPEEYASYTQAERARFAEVIRTTGVSLE
jgi:tripartite-type tricarboxylate transporter receptor subunit TctC